MNDIKLEDLTMDQLIDLLSEQTSVYVNLFGQEDLKKEFNKCKSFVEAIQAEIRSRINKK